MIKITKPYIIFLLIGVIIFSLMQPSIAQINSIGTPFINNYSRNDFQAGLQNWMIGQSLDGRIYFANNDGLLEFDGVNWNLMQLPSKTIVRSIYVADNGRIYTGGYNEIGYFEPNAFGKLTYHSLLDSLAPDERNFDEIWRIHNTPDGLVFQSFNQLIFLKDDKLDVIKAPGIFHFSYFVNGELLLVDMENGLLRYTMGNFFPLVGTEKLKGIEIYAIIPFENKLLLATAEEGFYLYDYNTLEPWENPASEFLKRNQVYTGLRLDDNQMAFGTIQNGLLICNNEGIPLQKINRIKGLQNNTILCLYKDFLNNLWLGTDNGIDYLEINSPLSLLSYENGMGAGYTAILYEGILYLGTNRGVFFKEWEMMSVTGKEFELIEETRGQIWSLEVINDHLFCGTHNGTYIINGKSAIPISDVPGGWTYRKIPGVPNKIIGGTYQGLILIEKKVNNRFEVKRIKGFNESSRFIEVDKDGSMWMSHGFKGVYHIYLNETLDSITTVDFYNSANGFSSNYGINVTTINGDIFFNAADGLYTYNQEKDHFEKNRTISDQFTWNRLSNIKGDNNGNIWYFADNSLGVLKIQEDGSYFDISLPFKQLSGNLIGGFEFVYPIDEQNVIIGSSNGFVFYNPVKLKDYQQPFNVFITRVSIYSPDSLIFSGHNTHPNLFSPLLGFKNNSVYFSFAANNFENPIKTEYATFLEGYDSEWSGWDIRNNREFTNLHEGEYIFRVKARNIYGTETEAATYSFTVNPPWRRTFVALIIYVIFGLIISGIAIVLIRKKMEHTKQKEKKLQEEKFRIKEEKLQRETLEAEKEIIRLRNEQLREQMTLKDKELANATLEMIQKNKLLTKIKNDLRRIGSNVNDFDQKDQIQTLTRQINKELDTEKQWEVFETHFENVHEAFLKRLKSRFPDLSPRELKLCAYLRLNISSKEIAILMNISTRGVEISRYRLRKKLNLERNENLTDFILSF